MPGAVTARALGLCPPLHDPEAEALEVGLERFLSYRIDQNVHIGTF
jgi:hypothetical protein